MSIPPFIGRKQEIEMLQDRWESNSAELIILHGRRRTGKTRLLTEWLQSANVQAFYWVANPSSPRDLLRSFSMALYAFEHPDWPTPSYFSYRDWEQAFREIARLAQKERVMVILDDFDQLLAIDDRVANTLQPVWDQALSKANLVLVFIGSNVDLITKQILAYRAPMFGRATAHLILQPLPFVDTTTFFPKYRPSERVALYAMLGGIPAYWQRFDPNQNIAANIAHHILDEFQVWQDETRLLLQDFFSETHNYMAILSAIAHDAHTPKEIAELAGLPEKHIPAYLRNLVKARFVERLLPVNSPLISRMGRHEIVDPYLRFYFRLLVNRQAQLVQGRHEQVAEELKSQLPLLIGRYTWPSLCREWILRAGPKDRLPFWVRTIGGGWIQKTDVRILGIHDTEQNLLLGECSWTPQLAGKGLLEELIGKTSRFVPARGQWTVHYAGFARSGWTPEAQQFAAEISKLELKGANWNAARMGLLDLEQVDHDLLEWTRHQKNT